MLLRRLVTVRYWFAFVSEEFHPRNGTDLEHSVSSDDILAAFRLNALAALKFRNVFRNRPHLPLLRAHTVVAEHVEEEGLNERVELGEGGAALGSQGICAVEQICNSALLRKWGQ